MTINLKMPDIRELKPRITVFGVGGAGGNAVNNMISAGLQGVDFVVANTDAQALTMSKAERIIQMGVQVTEGLGAGSQPEVGRAAAEEVIDEIRDHLSGAHMVFVTAGMGGGTGTGAAPVIARAAREAGILTVGVVTKPFHFEGQRRMRVADSGITELQKCVDTLLIIPNQNLFRVANEKTTFADAFAMADQVLYSGVACITDLMVKEGLINLDFADVRAVMREMGKAMMGTGEAEGEKRAIDGRRGGDRQSAARRGLDEGREGASDLDHRRPRPDPLRGRRGGDPHPRGGRPGRQHHRRRHLRRRASKASSASRWWRPASITRWRSGLRSRRRPRRGSPRSRSGCAPTTQRLAQRRSGPSRLERRRRAATAAAQHPAGRQRIDRIGQGGDGRGHPAAEPWLRGDHPAARAQALAVHRSGRRSPPCRRRRSRKPSSRRRPSGCRRAARACRGSTNCRSRRRTRSAPAAASSGEEHPEKRRMSLLQRLAAVGLGRRDDDEEAAPTPARQRRRCRQPPPPCRVPTERPLGRPMPRAGDAPEPAEPVSEYAKRPAPQGLDQHGRQAPVHNRSEEDQLDIPAFLRRQAN